jgi:rhodanese-related sulfurtransferase
MRLSARLCLLAMMLLAVACAKSSAIHDCTVDDLHAALDKPDTFVLDVRDVLAMGDSLDFLKGAVPVPVASLRGADDKIPKDKNIYVLGKDWTETVKAANILVDEGYPHVFRVQGGMEEYAKKYPLK